MTDEDIAQAKEPVLAQKTFVNENGKSITITIQGSVANADADGLYIRMASGGSVATYDMTALEADWLKSLLQEVI